VTQFNVTDRRELFFRKCDRACRRKLHARAISVTLVRRVYICEVRQSAALPCIPSRRANYHIPCCLPVRYMFPWAWPRFRSSLLNKQSLYCRARATQSPHLNPVIFYCGFHSPRAVTPASKSRPFRPPRWFPCSRSTSASIFTWLLAKSDFYFAFLSRALSCRSLALTFSRRCCISMDIIHVKVDGFCMGWRRTRGVKKTG